MAKPVRVLIIAGSDSGGGAGIQADIKTVTALGGYAMTAITAITVQNTIGVRAVHRIPDEIVVGQIEAVIEDLGVDVIKTGMIPDTSMLGVVFDTLDRLAPDVPRVVDPVMVATSGDRLMDQAAIETLKARALPKSILTPNVPEAEVLTGRTIATRDDMDAAARDLLSAGASAVLLKGGHLDGDELADCLAIAETVWFQTAPRIPGSNTHGTGCTLASALATSVGEGLDFDEAVFRARSFVRAAMEAAPGFGKGAGPLNHAFSGRQTTDP